VPRLGDVAVSSITTAMVRNICRDLRTVRCRRGQGTLKKSTVIRIHTTLNWALQMLTDEGRIAANPGWGTKPRLRKSEVYEPETWSPAELHTFLELVTGDEHYALWQILAMIGMRRGEALALQWGDLGLREHVHDGEQILLSLKVRALLKPKMVVVSRLRRETQSEHLQVNGIGTVPKLD
jgi:integrase